GTTGLSTRNSRTAGCVGADTIDRPVIRGSALSVNAKLARIEAVASTSDHSNYSGSKLDQRLKTPPIHGNVLCEVAIDDSTDRRIFRVNQRCAAGDGDAFRRGSGLQPEILLDSVLDVDHNSQNIDRLETDFVRAHPVLSWTNGWENVNSVMVCSDGGGDALLHIR